MPGKEEQIVMTFNKNQVAYINYYRVAVQLKTACLHNSATYLRK